jgi:hypothetical protein
MNDKKAKALRKVARNSAMMIEKENKITVKKIEYIEKEEHRQFFNQLSVDKDGKLIVSDDGLDTPKVETRLLHTGTITLNPTCERALYKSLKKTMRKNDIRNSNAASWTVKDK